MIRNLLVLGAGSAGLLAAITVKRKIPQIDVRIVRSPDIGVIGVGEGTTPIFPKHLFEYLNISRKLFYATAQPTWKLGIHFLWGPRRSFHYGFGQQLDSQWKDLPRPHGFYCEDDFSSVDLPSALMEQNKAFVRIPGCGAPDIHPWHAFHIENKKLVEFLETVASALGIEFVDGKVNGCQRGPEGISAAVLEDGRRLEADFFIDASGFRSELLGRTLAEPFISFDRSLFCDRAVIGGWDRTTEPILPYTTAETMDAGWCWQIEHETTINRGYVYASDAISDDAAKAEFLRKNPKAPESARVVKFRSGRYRRGWVENVVAIGNSCGFVEPLEATALMVVCWQCRTLVDFLIHTGLKPTPSMRDLYNGASSETWDEIRDFLAIHYRFNTRQHNAFWRRCRHETDIKGAAPLLEFYDENGPTGLCRYFLGSTGANQFGIEGFLVMLVGNQVPYRGRHIPTDCERQVWRNHVSRFRADAQGGMEVKEALTYIRHPGWRWYAES